MNLIKRLFKFGGDSDFGTVTNVIIKYYRSSYYYGINYIVFSELTNNNTVQK